MKKKALFFTPLFLCILLLTACGGESNTPVKIGEEFKIENNPITILKLEESKVLRLAKDEKVQVAPKGKKYIYLDVKNPKKEMIFLKAFSKEKELKSEENMFDYMHVIDSGFNDAYFLVDENTSIDKIVITTPLETEYVVTNPTATKNETTISNEVQTVLDAYSKGKAIGLLEGFKPFVKDGKSVFSIAKQEGSVIASNIMSNKAEVTYFTEDGKKYVMNITNIFNTDAVVTSYWENGKVTSIEVVED
jgi:hypothetical protein